jgi:hypothetical protein
MTNAHRPEKHRRVTPATPSFADPAVTIRP